MAVPEAPNGLRRWLIKVSAGVAIGLVTGLTTTSTGIAIMLWRDVALLEAKLETVSQVTISNRTLISACCAEGGDTQADLRMLAAEFKRFVTNLDKLLALSEKRLQRLEDRSTK